MFLSILNELKKKKNQENLDSNKDKKDKKQSDNKNKKDKNPKKDINKKIKEKKKSKIKKNKKEISNDNNVSFFTFIQSFLFSFVTMYFLVNIFLLMSSDILFIDGHFERYLSDKLIFVPNFNELRITNELEDLDIGDTFYYNYDKESKSWYKSRKGLKLKVLDKNDYFLFTEILNIKNYIMDEKLLNNQHIFESVEVSIPLKKYMGKYVIYFSLDKTIDDLRKEYNIPKQ